MKRGKISNDFLKTCEDDKIGEFCSTGTCDFTMNYGDETAISSSRSACFFMSETGIPVGYPAFVNGSYQW